jgi:hypothetical protein
LDRDVVTGVMAIAVHGLYGKTGELKDGLAERFARDRSRMDGYASHHDGSID